MGSNCSCRGFFIGLLKVPRLGGEVWYTYFGCGCSHFVRCDSDVVRCLRILRLRLSAQSVLLVKKQKVCMKTTEGLSSEKRPTDPLTHVLKSLTYRASCFSEKNTHWRKRA